MLKQQHRGISVFKHGTWKCLFGEGKTLRFHVKLQRCMNHPIETKTANWIVSPYLAVNTNLWKKTLGQVLMVYRFQINFLLTGKTIGYPWGIHHDVYMFVKRCHGKKTYENDKNSTDGSHMFRTHKNHYYWWTPHVFHPNHTFSGPQEVCTWLVSGFSPQYTTIYTIHHV